MRKFLLFLLLVSMLLLLAKISYADTVVNTPCEEFTDCHATYKLGDIVNLTNANADPSFKFLGWVSSGGECIGTGVCVFAITPATATEINLAPVYEPNVFRLWINVYGLPGGSVVSSPAGLDCPSNAFCAAPFPVNSKVVLTPNPPQGKKWNWRGFVGCNLTAPTCTVYISAPKLGYLIFK